MSYWAILGSVGSTGTNIYSKFAEYSAKSEASRYNRATLRHMANLVKEQMVITRRMGHRALGQHGAQVSGLVGEQRAAYAASGIKVDTGSAQNTQEQTKLVGRMDAMTIRENTQTQLNNLQGELNNLIAQHELSRKQQRWDQTGKWIGAVSALFGGTSTFGNQMYNYYGGKGR